MKLQIYSVQLYQKKICSGTGVFLLILQISQKSCFNEKLGLTSIMVFFCETSQRVLVAIFFAKSSSIDVWLDSNYASVELLCTTAYVWSLMLFTVKSRHFVLFSCSLYEKWPHTYFPAQYSLETRVRSIF